MKHDPNNLRQLFSEAADGPLTAAELRAYQLLADLLGRWRVLPEEATRSLSGQISSKVRQDLEARASAKVDQTIDPNIPPSPALGVNSDVVRDYQAVDDLLQSVAAPMPTVDWKAFSHQVSSAVRRESKVIDRHRRLVGRRYLNWSIRIAVPLAAAAVLALAFWPANPGSSQTAKAPKIEPRTIVVVNVDQPRASDGKVSVTYDEAKPKSSGNDGPVASTAIAIGPPKSEVVEIPMDPALLP